MTPTAIGGAYVIYYNGGEPAMSIPYGTLPAVPESVFTSLLFPQGLEPAGDLDGNGLLDFIIMDGLSAQAAVLFQTAARTFTQIPIPMGASPAQIAVGDLNDDALDDIVIIWGSDGLAAVYYQNPAAVGLTDRLNPPVLYPAGPSPWGCGIMDVDGDGANDLIVGSRGSQTLNIFFQR